MNLFSCIIGILLALSAVCDAASIVDAHEQRSHETDMVANMKEYLSDLLAETVENKSSMY